MRHPEIEKAENEHEKAAMALIRAIKKAFPLFSKLNIRRGQYPLTVRVTGYSENWWHEPNAIYGENVCTGKTRKFFTMDVISILSEATEQ